MCYNVGVKWVVEFHGAVAEEIGGLPPKLQARLVRFLEMVETLGLEAIGEPHAKHLEGKLWELRAKSEGGIARALYVALRGRRVVVLHVFAKKSQKLPRRALDLARSRMKEMQE